jgi:hypothetical protein
MTYRRFRLACLAGLLLVGACTGGGDSGKPTSVDACGLLTAEQLDAVLAAREPESDGRLVATRHTVTPGTGVADAPIPTDTCEFTQVRERGNVERALVVRVTTGMPEEGSYADQRNLIDDLGDEAYFSGDANDSTVVVRRGDLRLVVELATAGRRIQPSAPAPLVTAARQALDRLPEDATVPGLAAGGPCAKIDRNAVAAALGGPPSHSRSRSSGDQDSCFFTTDRGRQAELTLTKHPDGRKATTIQRGSAKLGAAGVDAYWRNGEVLVYGNGQELSIRLPSIPVLEAKPLPGLIKLTGAAATAYGVRQPTRSPGSGDTGPCALLTPQEAGWLDLSEHEPAELRVVSRAVWTYGDGVPVDTCGYERFRKVAGERPDVEVGIAAGHYDPVADDDLFPKDRQPVDGLGDRAYFVHDSDEGWLVVERGQTQLTLHAKLSYQDENATVRTAFVRAARAAFPRLPADVEIAASVTDPACARIGAAVARSVNGELRYTRSVASHFAASCTYTMATGLAVQVGAEKNVTAGDLKKDRERGAPFDAPGLDAGYSGLWSSQGGLIKVFGRSSLLTISVHEPGKRAFPSDLGPADVALAKAAEPLLE